MNGVIEDDNSELISKLWNKYDKIPSADSSRTESTKFAVLIYSGCFN